MSCTCALLIFATKWQQTVTSTVSGFSYNNLVPFRSTSVAFTLIRYIRITQNALHKIKVKFRHSENLVTCRRGFPTEKSKFSDQSQNFVIKV